MSSCSGCYFENVEKKTALKIDGFVDEALGHGLSSSSGRRRESLSDIISQVRRQSSLSRTDSEDYDFLNESLKSSVFDESDSSEAESKESPEQPEEKRILPLGTPGVQVGRKSLKDIRALRNSIDQSLVKTPELKTLRSKAAVDEGKKLTHFESIQEEELSEEIPKTKMLAKSPFKKAIQSGSDSSDGDSIVFDEVFEEVLPSPPRKPPVTAQPAPAAKVQKTKETKRKVKTPTSSESSSSSSSSSESESSTDSSSSSSSESSTSKLSSKYGSDFESVKSSSSSSSSSTSSEASTSKASPVKKLSTEKPRKSKEEPKEERKKTSPVPDIRPKLNSSSESSKSTVRETNRTFEETLNVDKKKEDEKRKKSKERIIESEKYLDKDLAITERMKKGSRSSSSSSSSRVGETEREIEISKRRDRRFRSRRRNSEEPHTCQTNVHNMVESVIDTHVQMLDDFNRMEYAAVCEWTRVLRQFDRHDGPTSQRLREIVERRLNRKY
ncbi:hypothetical protein B9Z55_005668 [Caenorhabditis nigoni]|uniref:Uncharacterized protein n=1 Tax=Caenorhabditis nigoni TaxID=1611254 RepID=A0A2G5V1U1_9PELO|nr:hypothetical protein B9Z55_005668 [Caenorhabditis nigoni]